MKNIFLVWEENHGIISIWDDESKAQEEVVRVLVADNIDLEGKTYPELVEEEWTDCANYRIEPLNQSWLG